MKIGELSARTGASPRSLRYYEKLGLIASERRPNGYREYDDATAGVVERIRSFLDLGFPTSLIEQILPCTHDSGPAEADCAALVRRVTEIRDELDDRARRMAHTRDVLTAYLEQQAMAEGPKAEGRQRTRLMVPGDRPAGEAERRHRADTPTATLYLR